MTDIKDFLARVQKTDPETWEEIAKRATAQGRTAEQIAEEIYKNFVDPTLVEIAPDENDRVLYATKVFYTKFITSDFVVADPYELYVLRRATVREGVNKEGKPYKIAELFAIGKHAEKDSDPVRFAKVTFFNDDCALALAAVPHNTYIVKAGGGAKGSTLQLRANAATVFGAPTSTEKMDLKNVLEKVLPLVPVAQAANNVSADRDDLKLVRGSVLFSNVRSGVTKQGKNKGKPYSLGSYAVYDRSSDPRVAKGSRPFSITCDPTAVEFGPGAELFFIGPIFSDAEYGPKMQASAIIPIIGIPRAVAAVQAAPATPVVEAKEEADEFAEFDN